MWYWGPQRTTNRLFDICIFTPALCGDIQIYDNVATLKLDSSGFIWIGNLNTEIITNISIVNTYYLNNSFRLESPILHCIVIREMCVCVCVCSYNKDNSWMRRDYTYIYILRKYWMSLLSTSEIWTESEPFWGVFTFTPKSHIFKTITSFGAKFSWARIVPIISFNQTKM